MSSSNIRQSRAPVPSRRIFGTTNSVDAENDASLLSNTDSGPANAYGDISRISGRTSVISNGIRRSIYNRWTRTGEEGTIKSPTSERPPIPSALQAGEPNASPLPVLSMIVLSITMLGEFLSANVSTPFLLFMVKGFGEFHDEADIAFWTGILVATFFLTQFLTSLLWATVADKHGQRSVLAVSLFGSAITCMLFGTSTSLPQAIAIRLLQGIFAGAVGVARGCVVSITDTSNEGRAYAILGFCWGFGGVAGAIIGGSFESPALKWPDLFGKVPLLVKYPYLLPCALASSITLTGSILSCFLGRNGGPREGAIRLSPEKSNNLHPTILEEDPLSPTVMPESESGLIGTLKSSISQRLSGYLGVRGQDADASAVASSQAVDVPMSSRLDRNSYPRTNRVNGSAYGYSGTHTRRSSNSALPTRRRGSQASLMRRGRYSGYEGHQSVMEGNELNFAQRLLMANENAVTNIADLWVAAALNADNEEVLESDIESDIDEEAGFHDSDERIRSVASAALPSSQVERAQNSAFTHTSTSRYGSPHLSFRSQPYPSPSLDQSGVGNDQPLSPRRPSIFAHSGVRVPSTVLDAQSRVGEYGDVTTRFGTERPTSSAPLSPMLESPAEKPPSLASQLPILIIIQYGMLALHSTTHDQVFLSYLVSNYEAGGLNLNAGHFAQLIALMCLAQIIYQFYLYPNIGPPRGRFSHLAMLRLGSLLSIPAYLTVILYRVFASASDDGNFLLMTALSLSTAVRYCGNTFGYTAISILLNYMTPPHVVGYANGVAQSIVSLARCLGPVLGGYLWAASTQDNPSGYPIGFLACAGACTLAIAHSFFIR